MSGGKCNLLHYEKEGENALRIYRKGKKMKTYKITIVMRSETNPRKWDFTDLLEPQGDEEILSVSAKEVK